MRKLSTCIVVVALAFAACKDGGGKGKPSKEVQDRVAKLQQEEGDFLARRDQLKDEKAKIASERAALAERRKQVAAAGGDPAALAAVDQEEAKLAERETALTAQEKDLDQGLQTLLTRYQELSAAAGSDDVARREASVAVREKDFSRRESDVAKREAQLADRERALALREKETCGAGGTTIVQAAPLPKGAKYSKRDVEPVLQKARKKMSEKGIRGDDLPAPAQALEREAIAAMSDADFGKAKFAADQLYATVDSMKVDKGFVVAKINRLNALIKAKPPEEGKRKDVDDLFRGATGDYGDGKFSAANSKLNKIYAILN